MEGRRRDMEVRPNILSLRGRVFRVYEVFLDLLFPRRCVWCGKEGELMCEGCREREKKISSPTPACAFCGKEGSDATCEVCKKNVFLDGVSAAAMYRDPAVRRVLRVWKYDGDQAYGYLARSWMWEAASHLGAWPHTKEAVVTYIPLHGTRRRTRGFDQAEELAKAISDATERPLQTLLARTKKTRQQARLDRSERHLGELDDVFSPVGNMPAYVLLCDDVFTTGTTMDAAARALKEAGVKEVWGCVLAKGGETY